MRMNVDLLSPNFDYLVSDSKIFEDFVYTPMPEALNEYHRRWNNRELEVKISEYLERDIPHPFVRGHRVVLDRQLCSPNFELLHFVRMTRLLDFDPMFLEYLDDKFTSNNPIKHALGKMKFQQEERGNVVGCVKRTIINFNSSSGKKINEVQTVWGESLIDFHHKLLNSEFANSKKNLYDASAWLKKGGGTAKDYYIKNTALFVRNGILFENYSLQGCELDFVRDIFLPSFVEVWKNTGNKPLIVALLPTESQNDKYWLSYPQKHLEITDSSLMGAHLSGMSHPLASSF
ncbi:MAG: hypothetical protein WCS85_02025 [Candidatus Peribacteraceae bacterium]|jgi:hypothetical protein